MARAQSLGGASTTSPTPSHSETRQVRKSRTITTSTEAMDLALSPESGSGNESAPGSEQQDEPQSPDGSTGHGSVQAGHGDEDMSASTQTQMPVQKRRRVTRACDECRRKKIKCDGKQPCTHCSVYSYECTYDKPSNRRRNPAPQYIEALENKLARAEALLRELVPEINLNDPNLDSATQQEFQNRNRQRLQAMNLKQEEEPRKPDQDDAQITSMIETVGQLDLDESGGWDFRGTSSGDVFLRRMEEHFGGLLGHDLTTTFLPRPMKIPGLLNLDAPISTVGPSPGESLLSGEFDLPPKNQAHKLSSCALACATALLRIVHVPSFFERLEMVYGKPTEDYDTEDKRFIGLLYSVMAVGAIYNVVEKDGDRQAHYMEAAKEGMKYYTSAKKLLQDVTDCRDLTSLQGLLFLILFLQSTSNLSACYAFLGIASRAALRMGLHRHLPQANFTPLVTELRRRIFYFIRQLDIYCSALLGIPILLRDEDIDQQLPTEVDDEYITAEGIQTPPAGTPGSFFQAFNAHSRLMTILMKVVKHIYPLKGAHEGAHATYMIDYHRIQEIESDLQIWQEQLPERWRPSAEGPMEVMRVRALLRFAYAHVQMMLYRPFLHYSSPRLSSRKVNNRYYACAAAGISVSRNIVNIATEIKNQALVVGPFWSMLYTEFYAILTLVFYALENPGSVEIFAAATAGREMITNMASRSFAADRISDHLNTLWDNLPESVKKGQAKALPSRKRAAPGPKTSSVPPATNKNPVSATKIASAASKRSLKQVSSFDSAHRTPSQRALAMNYSELHPLDVSSMGPSSDVSSGTPSTARSSNHFMRNSQTLESPGIFKLDTTMFSSGDPFAYPNQPLLDYGGSVATHPETQPSNIPDMHNRQTDARNFYMPGFYGNIEGQLMGSLPQYLMQSASGQNNLDLYQSAHSLAVHPTQAHHTGHGQQPHHVHHPHPNREMDEIVTDSGFNRTWDMFG